MNIKSTKKRMKTTNIAIVKIPLSSLRCILAYPKENKIICEIDVKSIKRVNESRNLDEIINESRLDYGLGNYKTFASAEDLIAELRS